MLLKLLSCIRRSVCYCMVLLGLLAESWRGLPPHPKLLASHVVAGDIHYT
jgi:hypothetical protein